MRNTLYSCSILKKLEFSRQTFEKVEIYNFMKIRPVVAELFHTDRRMDRYDEANNRFSQFYERAYQIFQLCYTHSY